MQKQEMQVEADLHLNLSSLAEIMFVIIMTRMRRITMMRIRLTMKVRILSLPISSILSILSIPLSLSVSLKT